MSIKKTNTGFLFPLDLLSVEAKWPKQETSKLYVTSSLTLDTSQGCPGQSRSSTSLHGFGRKHKLLIPFSLSLLISTTMLLTWVPLNEVEWNQDYLFKYTSRYNTLYLFWYQCFTYDLNNFSTSSRALTYRSHKIPEIHTKKCCMEI